MIDSRKDLQIIIANEDLAFLNIASSYLSQFFYVKAALRTGDDLIRAVPRMNPDIVVADIDLPIGDGLDVMLSLRALGLDSLESPIRNALDLAVAFAQVGIRTPFVLMGTETEGVECFLERGVAAFVHKYDLYADLKEAVLLAVEGRRFISRSSVKRSHT